MPMLVAAALVVPLLIMEQQAASEPRQLAATVLNWVIWLAFVAEAVVMLAVVPSKREWLRRHPLEILLIVATGPLLPPSLQAFRAIRLLRLMRLALFARRVRHLLTPGGVSQAALLSLVLVLAGGAALRTAEPGLDLSYADATWWALTTATTVGYGDIVPSTLAGRAVASLVMGIGIGFVALLTAALARQFGDRASRASRSAWGRCHPAS